MCVSGCGRYQAPRDGHECCIACLGLVHAEAAFMDESCTIVGRWPSRSWDWDSSSCKGTESQCRCLVPILLRGLLRAVVWVIWGLQWARFLWGTNLLGTWTWVELPGERGGPSQRCAPSVSFGAPPDDLMSIAASEGESDFSRDDASAQLPPSGMEAVPDTDLEMMAMLSWAANRIGLLWNPPLCGALEAGRLVSRGGTRWFLATHPGSFLPGSAHR